MARLRAHLSYANVISTLCLFLLLAGGTAYAVDGSNTVFSDDLVNGEVKVADIASAAGATKKILARGEGDDVRAKLVATRSGRRATVHAVAAYVDGLGNWQRAGRARVGERRGWRWRHVGAYELDMVTPRDETPLVLKVKLFKSADPHETSAPFRFWIEDGRLVPLDA